MKIKNPSYLILILLLWSCAQQRGLSGGEKDTTPPNVVASFPPNESVAFVGNKFEIQFDEYVQTNAIAQELIISPPLSKPPKVRIRQKTVVVSWDENLLPNTTYVFQFGNGIADVNESNKAEDLYYVFSTGNTIDSLALRGKVKLALSDEPAKSIKVLAFAQDTSIFSKKPQPNYFARTTEQGAFQLRFMNDASYFIYALDDVNGNYRYDEGEGIAFLDQSVQAATAKDSSVVSFLLSTPRSEKPAVSDYQTDSIGYLQFAWDRYFTGVEVGSLTNLPISQSWNKTQDSIRVWLTGKPINGFAPVVVRWKNELQDTLEVPFFEEAFEENYSLQHNLSSKIKAEQPIAITAPMALQWKNENALVLLEDSVAIPTKWSNESHRFALQTPLKPGKKYDLTILPDAFQNIQGKTPDTLHVAFQTYKNEELGELQLQLTVPPNIQHGLLTIKNKSNEVVFEMANANSGLHIVPKLAPGDYSVVLLDDRNDNGIFDPVQLEKKIQPERYYVIPSKLNVRSNWQLKQNWVIEP